MHIRIFRAGTMAKYYYYLLLLTTVTIHIQNENVFRLKKLREIIFNEYLFGNLKMTHKN